MTSRDIGKRAGRKSQRIVPQGLPQGERKRQEQLRSQAGIANEVGPPTDTPVSQLVRQLGQTPGARRQAPPRPSFDALLEVDPQAFRDANRPVQGGPLNQMSAAAPARIDERLAQIGRDSNNRLAAEVAERMRKLRGGR